MPKLLNIDEMLQCANDSNMPDVLKHTGAIEKATTKLAQALAKHLGIITTCAEFEGIDLAGTCAPFYAVTAEQPIPEALEEYDKDGDWETIESNRIETLSTEE